MAVNANACSDRVVRIFWSDIICGVLKHVIFFIIDTILVFD